MFLLDTTVLSALMSAEPLAQVAAWVARQPSDLLFTTAINQAEILSGLAVMPAGHRRSGFEAAARAMFLEDLEGRVLPFDGMAAAPYAEIFEARRRAGRPSGTVDLMIAAIARSHDAIVVTRNVSDFDGCGVAIVNP